MATAASHIHGTSNTSDRILDLDEGIGLPKLIRAAGTALMILGVAVVIGICVRNATPERAFMAAPSTIQSTFTIPALRPIVPSAPGVFAVEGGPTTIQADEIEHAFGVAVTPSDTKD